MVDQVIEEKVPLQEVVTTGIFFNRFIVLASTGIKKIVLIP